MILRAKNYQFILENKPCFLLGTEFQYFRIDPSIWEKGIDNLKEMGCNFLTTYIPWSWHEYEEGFFDFSGQTHRMRNLVKFLEIVKNNHLPLIVRPGPFIYAEFLGFGIPLWVGQKYPETIMRKRNGTPIKGSYYNYHSINHPTFKEKIRNWFENLIPVLQQFFQDSIIALQLDNITGHLYQNNLARLDFNPVNVKQYREFLHQKYMDIQNLNQRWKKNFKHFEQIPAPTLNSPFGAVQDWQWYMEANIGEYLEWLQEIMIELNCKLPLIQNLPGLYISPINISEVYKKLNYLAFNLTSKISNSESTFDFPFATSIIPIIFRGYQSSRRPPFCMETEVSWNAPGVKTSESVLIHSVIGCLSHSIKAISLYMGSDCEEADGQKLIGEALLDLQAEPSPKYGEANKLFRFIKQNAQNFNTSEEIVDNIGILNCYPNYRLVKEDYLISTIPKPDSILSITSQHGLLGLLLNCGYNPDIIDIRHVGITDLMNYRVIFLFSRGILGKRHYTKLMEYVQGGGTLVVFGKPFLIDLTGNTLPDFLHPLKLETTYYPYGYSMLLKTILRQQISYRFGLRRKINKIHRYSLHSQDNLAPVEAIMNIKKRTKYLMTNTGESIPFHMEVNCFEASNNSILSYKGKNAGYQINIGKGKSILIGTLLANEYMLPYYYRLKREDKIHLKNFFINLLQENQTNPKFYTSLELETVLHRLKNNRYGLFIISRTKHQEGEIIVYAPEIGKIATISVLYRYKEVNIELSGDNVLSIDIPQNGVIYLELSTHKGLVKMLR